MTWVESRQRLRCRLNYRLENRSTEVEPSKDCIHVIHAGEFLCLTNYIHESRMAATGLHNQPLVAYIHYQCLVV